jgi:hypothetical protein
MNKKKENYEQALENLKEMISSMKHGSITLVVQDNYVIQMEKNEKIRLK